MNPPCTLCCEFESVYRVLIHSRYTDMNYENTICYSCFVHYNRSITHHSLRLLA